MSDTPNKNTLNDTPNDTPNNNNIIALLTVARTRSRPTTAKETTDNNFNPHNNACPINAMSPAPKMRRSRSASHGRRRKQRQQEAQEEDDEQDEKEMLMESPICVVEVRAGSTRTLDSLLTLDTRLRRFSDDEHDAESDSSSSSSSEEAETSTASSFQRGGMDSGYGSEESSSLLWGSATEEATPMLHTLLWTEDEEQDADDASLDFETAFLTEGFECGASGRASKLGQNGNNTGTGPTTTTTEETKDNNEDNSNSSNHHNSSSNNNNNYNFSKANNASSTIGTALSATTDEDNEDFETANLEEEQLMANTMAVLTTTTGTQAMPVDTPNGPTRAAQELSSSSTLFERIPSRSGLQRFSGLDDSQDLSLADAGFGDVVRNEPFVAQTAQESRRREWNCRSILFADQPEHPLNTTSDPRYDIQPRRYSFGTMEDLNIRKAQAAFKEQLRERKSKRAARKKARAAATTTEGGHGNDTVNRRSGNDSRVRSSWPARNITAGDLFQQQQEEEEKQEKLEQLRLEFMEPSVPPKLPKRTRSASDGLRRSRILLDSNTTPVELGISSLRDKVLGRNNNDSNPAAVRKNVGTTKSTVALIASLPLEGVKKTKKSSKKKSKRKTRKGAEPRCTEQDKKGATATTTAVLAVNAADADKTKKRTKQSRKKKDPDSEVASFVFRRIKMDGSATETTIKAKIRPGTKPDRLVHLMEKNLKKDKLAKHVYGNRRYQKSMKFVLPQVQHSSFSRREFDKMKTTDILRLTPKRPILIDIEGFVDELAPTPEGSSATRTTVDSDDGCGPL